VSTHLLDALDRILERGGEPDDVLRATTALLVDEPTVAWAGMAFLEEGDLVLGPAAGKPDEAQRVRVPIAYQGKPVGELWVDGEADRRFLEKVAARISAHVLIGWDTGGEGWEP
jgi:putative methionine-R-sulfoxide reductase with GAF domain